MLVQSVYVNSQTLYCVLSSFLSDNKPEDCKSTAAYDCSCRYCDADGSTRSKTVVIVHRRIIDRRLRIGISAGIDSTRTHGVITSIALAVVIAVNVSRLVCLVTAFALVPMLVCIGYPSRAVAMSMRRRRCSHCISASVASAVVIAVVVSSLIKLLTVTACAFVPVMSFVLLPLCFCTVICQFAIGLTANHTYRLRGAGCGTAGVLMVYSYTTFVTVSVNGIGIIATFISYLSASIIAQVIVIVTVRVFTNVGHATVSVANVIGILVQMSESHARGFGTVTAS